MPNRREFLVSASASTAAFLAACSGAVSTAPAPVRLDALGVGLFTVPKSLAQDLEGTLAMIAGLGYREVEFFGPYSFSTQAAQDGWKAASQQLGFSGSGFFGRTASDVRAILDRHGLVSPSMHVDLETLRDRTEQVGEAANAMGWKYCGLASIPEELRRTPDDYRRMGDLLTEIGHRAKPMGFKVLYHNHGYGLLPVAGRMPIQLVFDRLDPDVVSLEMDVFWTVAGGADPVQLLDAYPKLYRLMHVKDMTRKATFTRGGDMQDIMSLFPLMTTVGNGVLDMPRILGHARRNGVEHFYVEQDLAADPQAQLAASIRYLRGAQLGT